MPESKITLYVDIVSPYAYLGFYMLRHHPIFIKNKIHITYVPIFLGGLMKACDNRPPFHIKNKDKWIRAQRIHWAEQFNIPLLKGTPENFPLPSLPTMRALSYIQLHFTPDQLAACLDALYHSYWVQGNTEVANPEGIRVVLEKVLGAEKAAEVALQGINNPEAKKHLIDNTDESFNVGAFGLPWFQCVNAKGEARGFWGFDNLGQVIRFLGLNKGDDVELKALL